MRRWFYYQRTGARLMVLFWKGLLLPPITGGWKCRYGWGSDNVAAARNPLPALLQLAGDRPDAPRSEV
jgi:hypothetical protein